MERKANDDAYADIVNLVNRCRAEYAENANFESNEFYASDLACVDRVLERFGQTRSIDELVDTLMQQDSYVRDFYADALTYELDEILEDNWS